MASILQVLSSCDKATIQDEIYGKHNECYLTLGDQNSASKNRYYVCLSGKDAEIKWQPGDYIMVELSLLAYKTKGQWYVGHYSDSVKCIEIDI